MRGGRVGGASSLLECTTCSRARAPIWLRRHPVAQRQGPARFAPPHARIAMLQTAGPRSTQAREDEAELASATAGGREDPAHQADVGLGERLGAARDLRQHGRGVSAAEHGELPHRPVPVVIVALRAREGSSAGTISSTLLALITAARARACCSRAAAACWHTARVAMSTQKRPPPGSELRGAPGRGGAARARRPTHAGHGAEADGVGVADIGVRGLRELQAGNPAIAHDVVHLASDLVGRQGRQVREGLILPASGGRGEAGAAGQGRVEAKCPSG